MQIAEVGRAQVGTRFRFRHLEFYALSGSIVLIDQTDGNLRFLSIKEFLDRAKEINRCIAISPYADERRDGDRFASHVGSCIREAMDQGDAESLDVQRERAKLVHRRASMAMHNGKVVDPRPRRASSFSVRKDDNASLPGLVTHKSAIGDLSDVARLSPMPPTQRK